MHLKKLFLKQYRNISSDEFTFNPEFNFIYGKNAQGKTNLIEAIYYLAELKSFRTTNKNELIQKNALASNLTANFEKDELAWDISITLSSKERKVLLNNKAPKNRKEYYELIPLILFEPRHIYVFRDSPSKRRQYLNRALYIQDVSFLSLLKDYEKALSQKNRLLKDNGDPSLITIWNDKLVSLGAEILFKRLQWFKDMKVFLEEEYKSLSHTGEVFHLNYVSTIGSFEESTTLAEIEVAYKEKFIERSFDEQLRRETLVGPHRDDFISLLDERSVGDYGSQGENRSAVIALKLAQLKMFAQKYKKTPLFLLDDVASELDEDRCQYLFSYLRDEKTQVFLTTTENHIKNDTYKGHANSYLVENGSVSQI